VDITLGVKNQSQREEMAEVPKEPLAVVVANRGSEPCGGQGCWGKGKLHLLGQWPTRWGGSEGGGGGGVAVGVEAVMGWWWGLKISTVYQGSHSGRESVKRAHMTSMFEECVVNFAREGCVFHFASELRVAKGWWGDYLVDVQWGWGVKCYDVILGC
jgi:hypothetical protein